MVQGKPPPQIGRRERKKREVRRRILRAAAQLFADKGYEGATIDEITRIADIAKGTFFNYYPRKDALLPELALELLEDLEDEIGAPESWEGSYRQRILRFLTELGALVHRDPQLFMVMVVENVRALGMRPEEEGEREIRRIIEQLLERAVEHGEFPIGIPVDVATRLIEAAYATATIDSLRKGSSVSEYRREMGIRLNIMFRGLGGEAVALEGNEE